MANQTSGDVELWDDAMCYYGRATWLHADCYLHFNARISATHGANWSLKWRKNTKGTASPQDTLWPWHRLPWAVHPAYFQSHDSWLEKCAKEIPKYTSWTWGYIHRNGNVFYFRDKKETSATWNPNIVSRQEEAYHLPTLHIQHLHLHIQLHFRTITPCKPSHVIPGYATAAERTGALPQKWGATLPLSCFICSLISKCIHIYHGCIYRWIGSFYHYDTLFLSLIIFCLEVNFVWY